MYIEDERGKRRRRHGSGYSDDYSDDDRPDTPSESKSDLDEAELFNGNRMKVHKICV